MVSFTKFCSLGKNECKRFKDSAYLPSLNSFSQEEPIPKRSTGSAPAEVSEAFDVGRAERAQNAIA